MSVKDNNWQDFNKSFFKKLGDDEIHVYCMKFSEQLTDSSFEKGLGVLDEDSKKSALRFKFKHLQEKYIQSQFGLRYLLSNYLNINSEDVKFRKNSFGKPYLLNNKTLNFNISHSNGYVVFAFSIASELGIDIEKVSEKPFLDIARRFFSLKEFDLLSNEPNESLKDSFFRLWTRKEAYVKAIGKGLSHSLSSFSMDITTKPKFLDIDLKDKWGIDNIYLKNKSYFGSIVFDKSTNNKKICFINMKNML